MQHDLEQSRLSLLGRYIFGDLHRIIGWVILVGALGGSVGFAFIGALHGLGHLIAPTRYHSVVGGWGIVGMMAGVGLAVGLITRLLGTPGDVELLVNNIHVLGGSKDIRDLKSLIPVSLLCIAGGGAAGPEAPLVQTTGGVGTVLANWRGFGVADRRILTITGMAAGFTVLFGAPLGSAIFALEILHRRGMEYYEALMPAILGSLIGYGVFVLATGLGLAPVWQFPLSQPLQQRDIFWAVPAGIVGAVVAVAFTYFNVALRELFHQLPMIARPVLGGVMLGVLGAFWSGYVWTFGEVQINELVSKAGEHPVASVCIIAAAAKFLGTSITISSGWRGGFIIPLFFIGAAIGQFWHLRMPDQTNSVVLMAALMVAINTGVTKTPIGSTLVVTEMAGLQLMPTTLIAAVTALLLTSEVGLINSQRTRDSADPDDRHMPSSTSE